MEPFTIGNVLFFLYKPVQISRGLALPVFGGDIKGNRLKNRVCPQQHFADCLFRQIHVGNQDHMPALPKKFLQFLYLFRYSHRIGHFRVLFRPIQIFFLLFRDAAAE